MDRDELARFAAALGVNHHDLAVGRRVHDAAARTADVDAAVAFAALRRSVAGARRHEARRFPDRHHAHARERMYPTQPGRGERERARRRRAALIAKYDRRVRHRRAVRIDDDAGYRARSRDAYRDLRLAIGDAHDRLARLHVTRHRCLDAPLAERDAIEREASRVVDGGDARGVIAVERYERDRRGRGHEAVGGDLTAHVRRGLEHEVRIARELEANRRGRERIAGRPELVGSVGKIIEARDAFAIGPHAREHRLTAVGDRDFDIRCRLAFERHARDDRGSRHDRQRRFGGDRGRSARHRDRRCDGPLAIARDEHDRDGDHRDHERAHGSSAKPPRRVTSSPRRPPHHAPCRAVLVPVPRTRHHARLRRWHACSIVRMSRSIAGLASLEVRRDRGVDPRDEVTRERLIRR